MTQIFAALLALPLLLTGCFPAAQADDAEAEADMAISQEETVLAVPDGHSIQLFYDNGQDVSAITISTWPELGDLREALADVRGYPITGWTVPMDPGPVYGLRVSGTIADYDAILCDGVWLDNQGHVLLTGFDFSTLWEQFVRDPKPYSGYLPCRRELALQSGVWDSHFLTASTADAPLSDIPMTLEIGEENISWMVSNHSGQVLSHGNGGGAGLEVLLDDVWYCVPKLSNAHYSVTAEGHILFPDKDFSAVFRLESYGALSDGTYRIVFSFDIKSEPPYLFYGYAAASFQIKDGVPALM